MHMTAESVLMRELGIRHVKLLWKLFSESPLKRGSLDQKLRIARWFEGHMGPLLQPKTAPADGASAREGGTGVEQEPIPGTGPGWDQWRWLVPVPVSSFPEGCAEVLSEELEKALKEGEKPDSPRALPALVATAVAELDLVIAQWIARDAALEAEEKARRAIAARPERSPSGAAAE
ncbi:MAG: hypothetical protein L0216_11175 [Planctomycetales bacterium]|nr:hypothetical protein [Planctomycetales bacterium]